MTGKMMKAELKKNTFFKIIETGASYYDSRLFYKHLLLCKYRYTV